LASHLEPESLLHAGQPVFCDEQGAEIAGPQLAASGEYDMDVGMRRVAMLAGNPRWEVSVAGVGRQLSHRGPRKALEVETASVLRREDKSVNCALARR
jgi:hypothetical protein